MVLNIFRRASKRNKPTPSGDDESAPKQRRRKIPLLSAASRGEDNNVCQASPRQMADWAHEMYLSGVFSWEEYCFAIPPETHPDYNRTIGALTGEAADLDQPRDMLSEWEDKLAFLRRHNALDSVQSGYAAHIVQMLRRALSPGGKLYR